MRSIQTAMAAGAAGIVAAGEALAAGVAAAGGVVVATYAGVAVVLIGGVYYYVTMDADPEASKPKVESFPEAEARPQSFTTPAHESKPTTHATPAHDQASSSNDKGFDTYEGPDARVFTSDGAGFKYEDAAYHHHQSRGTKSPAPTNGQKTLDTSIPFKPTSKARIGVDKSAKEFVVFSPSNKSGSEFHGHTRKWDELSNEMKSTLVRNGLTNMKGKIL